MKLLKYKKLPPSEVIIVMHTYAELHLSQYTNSIQILIHNNVNFFKPIFYFCLTVSILLSL